MDVGAAAAVWVAAAMTVCVAPAIAVWVAAATAVCVAPTIAVCEAAAIAVAVATALGRLSGTGSVRSPSPQKLMLVSWYCVCKGRVAVIGPVVETATVCCTELPLTVAVPE